MRDSSSILSFLETSGSQHSSRRGKLSHHSTGTVDLECIYEALLVASWSRAISQPQPVCLDMIGGCVFGDLNRVAEMRSKFYTTDEMS